MTTHLRLGVPRYGFDAEIETLPDLAPRSAAALREALPATGLVTSENHYGSVLCLRLPDFPRPLAPENATVFPIPGDVFLFERQHGVELVVFYERFGPVPAGTPFDSCGPKEGNRVGRVVGDLSPAMREAAREVWSEGAAWGGVGPVDGPAPRWPRDDREAVSAEIAARLEAWRRHTWRDHIAPSLHDPTAGRRVALIIPEYDARTEVELYPELAPHTCENIWDHLPVETTLMHGRYSGPEMFTQVGGRQWHWRPIKENQTIFPIPGDLIIYLDPPPRIQINYFHDRDAIPFGTPGPEPGNRVGRSVGDFQGFAEACWRVGYEGWKTLRVERR
ncbi:MAG: DUF3830 family protein [Chloroflexi bacterium]|nr:DUF3830 family protein [Chloroflexota bacterium]